MTDSTARATGNDATDYNRDGLGRLTSMRGRGTRNGDQKDAMMRVCLR